jgi:hypothetical protein
MVSKMVPLRHSEVHINDVGINKEKAAAEGPAAAFRFPAILYVPVLKDPDRGN